ncbi:MAG TPA: toll/interleukin-1 receptor domain-containing protein [Caldimonas sp.]|nr:toll/interleukin-1 receptor domain-containing protein [Caldimonas sp.]HEX4236039.1 toll/interleukin-1 receptor domain-containing protein [Caldimonas sp.]
MPTTSLFISHISEEAEYAALLKRMVQQDFLGLAKCFTSSDIGGIGAGENWLAAVEGAMAKAKAVIVLCSRASVHRPWVQFEVGAAWMRGMPVVPVCHSGMKLIDLEVPLSLRQGVELPTERGVAQLYDGIAGVLGMKAPSAADLQVRLGEMKEIEKRLRMCEVHQFERFIDIVLPPPGQLAEDTIPDDAVVECGGPSLQLFGLLEGTRLTWRDIVRKAQRAPDTRWLSQLQRCIAQASNNDVFRPVQAVYHTETGSYQPQLAKKEVRTDGSSRFHVHFVDTVVAPLAEVQNEFGTLATLLRLGLRFRYEVIERFQRYARNAGPAGGQARVDVVKPMRDAIETIECDAASRGAERLDREAVMALFDSDDDQTIMAGVQDAWEGARAELFRDDPPPSPEEIARVIARMKALNHTFMTLGTRRYHELVKTRWADPVVQRDSRAARHRAREGAPLTATATPRRSAACR